MPESGQMIEPALSCPNFTSVVRDAVWGGLGKAKGGVQAAKRPSGPSHKRCERACIRARCSLFARLSTSTVPYHNFRTPLLIHITSIHKSQQRQTRRPHPETRHHRTVPTMSELFDSYASDLQQLKDGIRQKLDQAKSQNGEAKKSTLRRAEMELEEADEVISQMDIEVQGFPQSVRSRYSVQIRGFKQEVQNLNKEVRAGLSSGAGRGGFNAAYADDDADLEAADSATANRQRLLQGTASLEDGTRRLEESNRLALETEDLGADILRDLRSQREQIENSRDTVSSTEFHLFEINTC